jgi:DNA invertase Pin-like site-specific DNA recombinase
MRFSDPRQESGSSSDRQAAYAAKWAAENGLVLDSALSLRDEGLSAYHQKHVKMGALGAFLELVDQGRVPPGSVLVVEALDRLSRAEPILAQAQLARIVDAGITVVTAADGKQYSREILKRNPMELVYSLLLMIRAFEESDTKSKRVKASIVRQCESWIAGTYRGLVRNGKDPAWLRWDGQAWQIVPDKYEATRLMVDLYAQGFGGKAIVEELQARGVAVATRHAFKQRLHKTVRLRALIGEKELEVDGKTYRLQGYYPPMLSQDEWDALQLQVTERERRKVRGELPGVITGLGILSCGYCGAAMVGQNLISRQRLADGRIRDSYRRLRCSENFAGSGCKFGGSVSVAPIERAIVNHCGDIMNLRSLLGGDRSRPLRDRVNVAKARVADIEQQLNKLIDIMLASSEPPAQFVQRAKALEAEQDKHKQELEHAELELAALARAELTGVDQVWRDVAAGVEAQEYEPRVRARQLVADTFQKIVVYWKGLDPQAVENQPISVALVAKGGVVRTLDIDAAGNWAVAATVDIGSVTE